MLLPRCEKLSPDPSTRLMCLSNCRAEHWRKPDHDPPGATVTPVQHFLVPQVGKTYLGSVQVGAVPTSLVAISGKFTVQLRLTPRLTATLHTLGAEFVPLTWQPSADSSTLPHTKINTHANTRRRSQQNRGHTLIVTLLWTDHHFNLYDLSRLYHFFFQDVD